MGMGIHNREYHRDESPPSGDWGGSFVGGHGGSGGPVSAVKVLVFLNVAVFLATWLVKPLGPLLHLPATFTVVAEGADVHLPAPSRDASLVRLPPGMYLVPLRSGASELERIRNSDPDRFEDLDTSFRSKPDDWVAVKIDVVSADGIPASVVGLLHRKHTRSIAWQFPWRVITYGFCHDQTSLFHLLFNMICLWMFGRLIEGIYGRREFLWIYLLGILVSGVCHLAWQLASGGSVVPMVGASGGVMAIMVLSAVHFPKMKVLLMMIIPVELGMLIIGLVALDVMRALGVFGGETHIAYMAHLGGAAFGYLYYRSGVRLSSSGVGLVGRLRSWRRRVVQPSVRVYQPPVDGLDDQVDAILEKISRQGEASLSDRERQLLMEASRRKRQET